jgi:hypothetical protein
MPLSINVGLSRKASKDYQSTGVSINVTAELDQTLLAKPDELQGEIDHLYYQAEQALNRQAQEMTSEDPPARPARNGNDRARGGNGRGNGNGHNNVPPMTQSQRRAINAIADRVGVDANDEAMNITGNSFDRLTLKQASTLIDHLKSIEPANGR